jgi:hypothetical protein
MKRLAATLAATLATFVLVAGAQADPSEYAIQAASAEASSTQAAGHPDFTVGFSLTRGPGGIPHSATHNLFFDIPPGLLANPGAVPRCSAAQFAGTDVNDPSNQTGCPQSSQVGISRVDLGSIEVFEPVYNLAPRYGEPARFGFIAEFLPVLIDTELRPDRGYAVTAKVEGASAFVPILGASTTFWGSPADESHDAQRITPYEAYHNGGVPDTPTGKRSAGLAPVPYMLNPARCAVAQGIAITAIPYALPSLEAKAFAPLAPNTGCGLLKFKPALALAPTTSQAETGAGLDADLSFPTNGLENPNLLGGAIQKRAEVTLPKGVTVNPSQAVGLGVCSEADFERETASSLPNEGCPETSKIGSVSATSPLVDQPAEGGLFIAKPKANPFGTLIALYLVLKIPDRGVIVKLAGKVVPDPKTGQLITTFGEAPYEIPQLPVSSFHLHFREGARSPLVTPPRCGTYASSATFTSWSGQVVTTHPSFKITSGVNGGPCSQGNLPFAPGFMAGTLNNNAASYSPAYMRLTRADGEQDLTRFSTTFPPGAVAKLAGVSQCPQAAIEAAKARTGLEELANPSCPASSQIGHVLAGAGVGQVLTYAEGKLYLAGPYHGDPLSVVAIVPAVAGPFDVGTVVTQEALSLNPETARAEVDGSASDPIPHILAGIPLKVRDVRVYVDRPDFTLNPTSCEPLAFAATLWGGGADVFSPADDLPVSLSSRFQAANCANLGFKPRLTLKLTGGTKRGGHPALKAIVRPRPGDANFASAVVTLPPSAFLDQGHLNNICTRVQFAAQGGNGAGCPPASVYGHARAKTPLLDEPLQGPVYLRSNPSHNLPDLVIALHGIVDIDLASRIDSHHAGIRSSFEAIPDAPVSEFVLEMQGGKKGLIENSADLCAHAYRAEARITAQNGRRLTLRPALQATSCKGKGRKGKHGRGGHRAKRNR